MNYRKLLPYLFSMTLLMGCETDDVPGPDLGAGPEVTISLSQQSIIESGGTAEIIATLSASSDAEVIAALQLGGTAVLGTDYTISAEEIIVPAGSITASVTVTAIDNPDQSGNTTVAIDLTGVTGGQYLPQSLSLSIEDDDGGATVQLIFNEVLYDPSNSGLDGDANGDGVYSQAEDEFLEIFNLSSLPVDISGWKVYDETALADDQPRHLFPSGSIIPGNSALVLFGGGTPTGTFGGSVVQTSTTGNMNLNNAGDIAYLFDTDGNEVLRFEIEPLSNNPNESYTRNPDITGEFEQHSDNTPVLFSPGTKIDGSSF